MEGNTIELIDLDKVIKDKYPKGYNKIPKRLISYLKRKIHQYELNDILRSYSDKDGVDFMLSCIDHFRLNLITHGLNEIPTDKKYIFVSNHPLGGLDGICLAGIIGEKFDKKIKYPVNDFLLYIRNLRSIFIPINKQGGQSKDAANQLNEAFESDNQIVTFPAGLCSRKINGKITDPEWKKMFLMKAIEYQRDVVPIYFEAKNSNFFYRLANIRKILGFKFNIEMLFLPDEMFKNKNKTFNITFGKPISWETFDKSKTTKQWVEYVRECTYSLREVEK